MTDRPDVASLAALCKLSLGEGERSDMERDLCIMLRVCESLADIEGDIIPSRCVSLDGLREDVPSDAPYDRERLLECAPLSKDGFIAVGRVLEESE